MSGYQTLNSLKANMNQPVGRELHWPTHGAAGNQSRGAKVNLAATDRETHNGLTDFSMRAEVTSGIRGQMLT